MEVTNLLEHFKGFSEHPVLGQAMVWDIPFGRREAQQWVRRFGDDVAIAIQNFGLEVAQIRYQGMIHKPLEVLASMAPSAVIPDFGSGEIIVSRRLYSAVAQNPQLHNAVGRAHDSDVPQGIILADPTRALQTWINPAAQRLFQLPNINDGFERDTTDDWYPEDLERKRVAIRDAMTSFRIKARIKINGSWYTATNLYEFTDESREFLLATSVEPVVAIASPELVQL